MDQNSSQLICDFIFSKVPHVRTLFNGISINIILVFLFVI